MRDFVKQEHGAGTVGVDRNPVVQHVHCDISFADMDASQVMDVVAEQHRQVIKDYPACVHHQRQVEFIAKGQQQTGGGKQ